MKTAISLPNELFSAVEKLAKEHDLSRSQVFTQAVREYLDRQQNREIFEALNGAYSEAFTEDEKKYNKQAKKYVTRRIRKEKW